MRKIISLLTLSCFLVSNISYSEVANTTAHYRTYTDLAPSLVFNAIGEDDAGRRYLALAEMGLQRDLEELDRVEDIDDVTDLEVLRKAVEKRERLARNKITFREHEDKEIKVTTCFNEVESIEQIAPHIFSIPVYVEEAGTRKDFRLLFSTRRDRNKGFPTILCAQPELDGVRERIRSLDVMPGRPGSDREAIVELMRTNDRAVRVFSGVDGMIEHIGQVDTRSGEDFLVLHEKFQRMTQGIREGTLDLSMAEIRMLMTTLAFSTENWTKAFAGELLYWQMIDAGRVEEGRGIAGHIGVEEAAAWSTLEERARNFEGWIGEFTELLPEGSKMDVKTLKTYVRGTTAFLPFIYEHEIPVVIAFDGAVLMDYPGTKPLRLYFTAQGEITDKKIVDGMLYEGVRLAEAMSSKNPLWQVYLDGRKGIHAAERTSFRSVSTVYGNAELFDKGLVMAKGGDRLDQKRRVSPDTTYEGENNDEDKVFADFTRAMVVARLMGYVFLSGPDRMRRVDHKMGVILDTADEIARSWNEGTTENEFKLDPFRATTSASEEKGSFSHMKWYVTSLGVVNGLLTVIRNKKLMQSGLIKRKFDPSKRIAVTIQGMGDVGSGIIASFDRNRVARAYQDKVVYRGINNVNCAVYSEKGISKEQLRALRDAVETAEDPDRINIFDLVDIKNMDKVWLAPSALLTYIDKAFTAGMPEDVALVKTELEGMLRSRSIDLPREEHVLNVLRVNGVIPSNVIGMDVNRVLYEDTDVIIPAAVANVFTDVEQIKALKCSIIVEGANNSVSLGLESALRDAGIAYFRGELQNGGGILTSKEEGFHDKVDGLEYVLANNEHFRKHIQGQITRSARVLNHIVLMMLEDSGYTADISELVYKIADDLRKEKERLLIAEDIEVVEAAKNLMARSANSISYRVALLEAASEKAFANVIYKRYLVNIYARRDMDVVRDIIMNEELRGDGDLFSNSEDRRLVAIFAAGRLRMREAIAPLLTILMDEGESVSVRDAAAESLSYIFDYVANVPGIEEDPAVRGLRKIMERPQRNEGDGDIAGCARWALEKMGLIGNPSRVNGHNGRNAGMAERLSVPFEAVPSEYGSNGITHAGLMAALGENGLLGPEAIRSGKEAGLIFSEKITFDNGLGILLPKLAKAGIKIGVVAVTPDQRRMIEELNKDIRGYDRKIIISEDPAAIQASMARQCYYYRVEGEDALAFQGMIVVEMAIENIKILVDSLAKACGLLNDDMIRQLNEARRLFAIAA